MKTTKLFLISLLLPLLASCGSCKHKDANRDHLCDECGIQLSQHMDSNNDHMCDICNQKMSDHVDSNNDHNCDTCGEKISNHLDNNKDHICDTCGERISECTDNNKDHNCDTCGKKLTDCNDSNKDHNCDICGTKLSDCSDTNHDHNCDYCGTKLSECVDNNNDHNCDECGATLTQCKDENPKDHNCDICGTTLSECSDNDKDGKCDICGTSLVVEKVYKIVTSDTSYSYDDGIELTKLEDDVYYLEVDVTVGDTFRISDGETSYTTYDKQEDEELVNAYLKNFYTIDKKGNARFNVDGEFTIYFTVSETPTTFVALDKINNLYKTVESLNSYSETNLLEYNSSLSTNEYIAYTRKNQTYYKDQSIQIKHNKTLMRFSLDETSISNAFAHYNNTNWSYINVLKKIDGNGIIILKVSLVDLSLSVKIAYQ